jgi:hypothetical protein
MARTLLILFRNPMDFGFKLMQAVFTAVIVVIVFGKVNFFLIFRLMTVIFKM